MLAQASIAARRVLARLPPIVVIAAAWFAGTLVVHSLAALPAAGVYVPLGIGALLALRSRATRWVAWGIAGFAWTAVNAQQRLDERLAPSGPDPGGDGVAGFSWTALIAGLLAGWGLSRLVQRRREHRLRGRLRV